MYIVPNTQNKEKINFVFHHYKSPYNELKIDRIEYPKGNFDCAMLVNDLRSAERVNQHEFLIVLFTANAYL